VREGQFAVRDLDGSARLAAQLADGLNHFGHAAAVGRMVVAQAAAIGVERQPVQTAQPLIWLARIMHRKWVVSGRVESATTLPAELMNSWYFSPTALP
jgi:hypothetical protein